MPATARFGLAAFERLASLLLGLRVLVAFLRWDHRVGGFIAGRGPGPIGSALGRLHWHLTQRDIFGEPSRGEPFLRARQQGETGAAGGVGTPGAAMEPRRDSRALERVLEDAQVGLRRAQQDGHLVEPHAATRLLHHTSSDLDRLAPFARSGEHDNGVVGRCGRWEIGREEMLLQSRKGASNRFYGFYGFYRFCRFESES